MSRKPAQREKRKPWLKWFTRDWRSNAKLRLCGFAARGLWADLISIMGEADPRGFLLVDGAPPTAEDLVSLLGGSEREIAKLMEELRSRRVYSVTGQPMPDDVAMLIPGGMPEGVILSRRMVRDEAKALADKVNGILGGNPHLKPQDNGRVNPPPTPQSQRKELESDSESVSKISTEPARDVALGGAPRHARIPNVHERVALLAANGKHRSKMS